VRADYANAAESRVNRRRVEHRPRTAAIRASHSFAVSKDSRMYHWETGASAPVILLTACSIKELLEDDLVCDELPPGVCPCCMGLSPGISIDGETIMHCKLCDDGKRDVTVEAADCWLKEMAARRGQR